MANKMRLTLSTALVGCLGCDRPSLPVRLESAQAAGAREWRGHPGDGRVAAAAADLGGAQTGRSAGAPWTSTTWKAMR